MKKLEVFIRKDKLTSREQEELLSFLYSSIKNGFSVSMTFKVLPLLWPKRKELFRECDREMQRGKTLAQCMQSMGFSQTTVTQLNLALNQGNLKDSLQQLSTLSRMRNKQIQKLQGELAYPVILILMMVFLLIFMQNFVSTQFVSNNEHMGDITIFLLVILVVGLIVSIALTVFYLKKQDYQSFKKMLRFPFVGPVVKLYGQYLISYDLGMLLASGFSLQKICEFASNQLQGSLQQSLGIKITRQLNQGKSLQDIITEEDFLNNNLLFLLETGDDKKEMSKQCLLIGQMLFDKLVRKIERMIVNVQPICFILIGICIIGMYLKLLMPMYNMMNNI